MIFDSIRLQTIFAASTDQCLFFLQVQEIFGHISSFRRNHSFLLLMIVYFWVFKDWCVQFDFSKLKKLDYVTQESMTIFFMERSTDQSTRREPIGFSAGLFLTTQ